MAIAIRPRMRVACLLVSSTLMAGAVPTWAARPFVTDDAGIVDQGACQIELWTQQGPDGEQYWALPACSPIHNLEVTAGAGFLSDDDGGHTPVFQLQGKTLFKTLTPGSWGSGVAAGAVLNSGILAEDTLLGNVFAYVPTSIATPGERLVAHLNLGVRYQADPDTVRMTWGVAGELELLPRIYAVGETFGDSSAKAYTQFGARFWIIPERLQVDATYGRQFDVGREGEWFTVGLRAISLPFISLGRDQ